MSQDAEKSTAKLSKVEKKLNLLKKRAHLIFRNIDCVKLFNRILKKTPDEILATITESGLRGRGGAGFPTGMKWKAALEAPGAVKYVICNADEGEPGTFKDRVILERQPDKIIVGMATCAYVTKATEGYIYMRGEYNFMSKEIKACCEKWNDLFEKKDFPFRVSLRLGSGAYICGEETALIESMSGNRGEPRLRPPFPVSEGFNDMPTVVNNVETLAYVTMIMDDGLDFFKSVAKDDSMGGKVFSVSGDAAIKGVFELPLGMTVQEFVDIFGDGDTKAVQVGGFSGLCVPRKHFATTIIGYRGVQTGGSMILYNSTRSMYLVLKNYLEFFQEESCGQCAPCRIGCQQLLLGIEAMRQGTRPLSHIDKLRELVNVMGVASKCKLGMSLANPFNSITEHFFEEICSKW
ncbi:MAG: NADH-ubiquinone oxidoreductase-F iron-sulfur binding region domain-containing protein [Alphaproteobacteria bacterium]|nr:NADH-ubiquinone oxidoreductase-F iron-sulfur binding region domain-containing protein [Alphaproteobacteria bacterium]